MMLTDDEIMDVIATRMSEECPWGEARTVLAHTSWVDVVRHLYQDKGLRSALIQAYTGEVASAMALRALEAQRERIEYSLEDR